MEIGAVIPHNRPTLGEEEAFAAKRVLESGWLASGKEVAFFEDEMCGFLQLPERHAVAVSSGSAALYLALLAAGGRKSQVAIPGYSCRSLLDAVRLCGGTADIIDTAEGMPAPSLSEWEASRAPVRVVAHIYGIPTRLSPSPGRVIIEDCSQSLGAKTGEGFAGTQCDIGIFSFGATKPITSGGQGGMIVCADRALSDYVRELCNYDALVDDLPRFNFQMTDLQAAIGRVQLQRLLGFIERRNEIFSRYRDAGLPLVESSDEEITSLHFRAVIRTNHPVPLQEKLGEAGIRAIVPVTREELLAPASCLPNAAALCDSTLSLPLYPGLTDQDVDHVISSCLRNMPS